jgi:hypothetical protein
VLANERGRFFKRMALERTKEQSTFVSFKRNRISKEQYYFDEKMSFR